VLEMGEDRYRVREARSALEFREALLQANKAGEPLIVLTDLAENQLAEDIRARLHRGRLREIDPWMVLSEAFRATRMDDRLRGKEKLALALLEHEPEGGFPAAPAGFLDAGMVWQAAMQHVLRIPSGEPAARHLLVASLDGNVLGAVSNADRQLVGECATWLESQGSRTSAFLLRFLARENAADCLPIGLVCQVVFHEKAIAETALRQAEVRLEAVVGQAVASNVGSEWGQAAVSVLSKMPETDRNRLRNRGDLILRNVQGERYAFLSCSLPSGYEQRLGRFAEALDMDSTDEEAVERLLDAVRDVRSHVEGRPYDHRNQKVEMAARLARWLGPRPEAPARLQDAVGLYICELAFVDWARDVLSGGDPVPEVQQAYQRLSKEAMERREAFNERFGALVAEWSGNPDAVAGLVLVEDFLSRVIAPAAQAAPRERVLVLVIDGMAWATCHELLRDLELDYGWVPVANSKALHFDAAAIPMLSTTPSVTEFARTSLLCGKLGKGDAAEEKAGFPTHTAIKSVCSTNNPARLFHRAELEEDGRQGLRDEVQKSIANPKNRVVGVVINAVDDFLLKSDQLRHTWTVNDIRLFEALLVEARKSDRMVILASDHGNVLDRDMVARISEEGGERWRPGTRDVGEGEVILQGPRVQPYGGRIVAPWTEKVRYGVKKNGYHGGVTPQEIIAPCCVLKYIDSDPGDWAERNRSEPKWWSVARVQGDLLAVARPKIPAPPRSAKLPKVQRSLFDAQQEQAGRATGTWVDRLMATELFKANTRLAGRRVPDLEVIEKALCALDEAGGQTPKSVLAARLEMPELRLQGLVAQLQRLLNVEGYPCIGFTSDGGHISINKPLLLRQFEIEADK